MNIEYAVQIIWSPEDRAYIAMAAELPGCIADGSTPEEAMANLRTIIQEWIETAKEDGREIPKPYTTTDFDRLQQEAQAHLQKQVEQQVKQAIHQVLTELLTRHPPTSVWSMRTAHSFSESEPESLVLPGGSRHR